MKIPKLQPREIMLLGITFGVAFLIANYLVIRPWLETLGEKKREMDQLRGEIKEMQHALDKSPQWKGELEKLAQNLDPNAPHVKSQEGWMRHFEGLASEHGVQLMNRKTTPITTKLNANQIRVDCSLSGSLNAIAHLLFDVLNDTSQPRIDICQLVPIKPGEDKLQGNLTISVTLKKEGSK